ncbi:MAG TPA: hypothetical protein DD379_20385 [Cyanobacteria bacterium UBA11162]|nr:hypothetical protein [Cyanobacteria bacterium UBA11162]
MALIEYLEHDDWRSVLRRSFEGVIALLQTERFRPTSSAIDDMRSWLTIGDISRVQLQLNRQMKERRLTVDRQTEIRDFLLVLVQENQRPIIQLMADGIIPTNQADFLMVYGISESEFNAILQYISSGANPFESWMLANGYSSQQIHQIYQIIDRWLVKTKLNFTARPDNFNLN